MATPIGNLEDITFRAVRILRDEVHWIACEDTRTTAKLLHHYEISKPLLSYHEHNEESRTADLLTKLERGESGALLSDAGTPLISDPGYRLVTRTIASGIVVTALPGPCAAITALAASGLPTDQFRFVGFLPPKAHGRRTALKALATEIGTLVLYESPHRVGDTLADIVEVLGAERHVVLARELTKLHEEVLRGTGAEVDAVIRARPSVKGEITLLISGHAGTPLTGDPQAEVDRLMEEGMERMEAIKTIAKQFGLPKREVYRLAMARDSSSQDTHRD